MKWIESDSLIWQPDFDYELTDQARVAAFGTRAEVEYDGFDPDPEFKADQVVLI